MARQASAAPSPVKKRGRPGKPAQASPPPPPTELDLDPSLVPDQPHLASAAASSVADAASSPTIRDKERHQLRVVVESLAPRLVLDQQLTVPDAPSSLRDCLSDSAPLLPLSVLRACLNSAATSALFSSATALDASQDESARLLNEVDDFQATVQGLLDEVERRYAAENGHAEDLKPTKTRRYMLHRTLPSGTDLFTSAAILSDYDLSAISQVEDTDLIAVHPPPSSSSSLAPAPVPSLGTLNPPAPPAPLPLPASQKAKIAPGQHPSIAPLLPALRPSSSGSGSAVRETQLLYYGAWASFAPSHDSLAATDAGYCRAASRALSDARVRRWERQLVPARSLADVSLARADDAEPEPQPQPLELTADERQTLAELNVQLEAFEQGAKLLQEEQKVWSVLERNRELLGRLGRMQVARIRRRAGRERGDEVKREEESAEGTDGDAVDAVDAVETEEADALLRSLSSLVAALSSTTSSVCRVLPSPALIRSLTPLIISTLTREASYTGTLDAADASGLAWAKAVKEGGMVKAE
ncbi:hypothetical protein JCM1841_004236 [Sporobolomyces salmonicolor]